MESNTATASEDADDERGFKEIVAQIWARRFLILIVVALTSVLFTVAAILITPKYRATVVLIPTNTERNSSGTSLGGALDQIGGLASLANIGGAADSETQEALAVLQSRQFTDRFIDEAKIAPELHAYDGRISATWWNQNVDAQRSPAKAYRYFTKNVRSVIQDKKTGLVTLQIDWKNRVKAAQWANELVVRLNAEMRLRAANEAAASLGFLQTELMSTADVGTREAIGRLIEAQIKRRMLANVTVEYAFRIVDKAMPPDEDDPITPSKLSIILAGPMTGLIIGSFLAVAFGRNRSREAQPPQLRE